MRPDHASKSGTYRRESSCADHLAIVSNADKQWKTTGQGDCRQGSIASGIYPASDTHRRAPARNPARWDYVDFERGILFLPESKTGKKPIYLSAAALAVLNDIPRVRGNPLIIPGESEETRRTEAGSRHAPI